jgi:hypothetical protein
MSSSDSFSDAAATFDLYVDTTFDGCCEVSDARRAGNYAGRSNRQTSAWVRWQPLLMAALSTAGSTLKMVWASPWSLWAILVGSLGLLTGGHVQRSGRLLEFWGGALPLFLKYFPFVAGSPVATFGHVVLGRTQRHLDACRPHQLIHVKQYECWGPLFGPVYVACSVVLWVCGKRPYYDNPFEREAFDKTM